MNNDELTLDVDQMKRSIKLVTKNEDEVLPTLIHALGILFKQIQNELTNAKTADLENDANFLNIFFTIFQLPYLSDPGWIHDTSRTFYSLFRRLPADLQTKFIRVLAKHKSELSGYVAHVQQYITIHTFRWSNRPQTLLMNEVLLSSEPGREFETKTVLLHSHRRRGF